MGTRCRRRLRLVGRARLRSGRQRHGRSSASAPSVVVHPPDVQRGGWMSAGEGLKCVPFPCRGFYPALRSVGTLRLLMMSRVRTQCARVVVMLFEREVC